MGGRYKFPRCKNELNYDYLFDQLTVPRVSICMSLPAILTKAEKNNYVESSDRS